MVDLPRVPNTITTDEIVMIKITQPKRQFLTFSFTMAVHSNQCTWKSLVDMTE